MAKCETCGAGVASLRLRRWHAEPSGTGIAVAGKPVTIEACGDCGTWLARALGIGAARGPGTIYGVPAPSGRRVVFNDQCRICRLPVASDASVVAIDTSSSSVPPRSSVLLCGACTAWFVAVASDLRSVRGLATRNIDGPYGQVIHGNVGEMTLCVATLDDTTHQLIATVAERMGARIIDPTAGTTDAQTVLVVELARPTDPVEWRTHPGQVIALVPEALRGRLPEVATASRADWITLPATPQQVAHALLRAARFGYGLPRDSTTGLPIALEPEVGSPLLAARPAAGADPQLVAWRLKRYARGYDEIAVTTEGVLVVVPRCEPGLVPTVASRLDGLLGGLARVERATVTARRAIDLSG